MAVVTGIAIALPLFRPPYLLGQAIYTYAHGAMLWHPLFSVLLAVSALIALVAAAVLVFEYVPRPALTLVGAIYFGVSYYQASQQWIGLDQIWSGGIGILMAVLGGWASWWVSGKVQAMAMQARAASGALADHSGQTPG